MLFNHDEEGLELEIKCARRETDIHRSEDLHARSGQAFGLSQKMQENICRLELRTRLARTLNMLK